MGAGPTDKALGDIHRLGHEAVDRDKHLKSHIYRGESLRAIKVGTWDPDGPCVVTFDCYQVEDIDGRQGFGEAFFESRAIDAVHVMSRQNDWYQDEEIEAALDAIAATLRCRSGRIITYGASMGGYAALRFANRLNASSAIAIAPQFSIDPAIAPFDRRWKESQQIKFRSEINGPFLLPERAVVIYDPKMAEDARHVDLFKAQGDLQTVPVLYSGHSAGLLLSQLNLLGEFVIDMLEDRGDPRNLISTVRASRRQAAQYWATLAQYASERRVGLAVRLSARAVELAPQYAEYRHKHEEYDRRLRAEQAARQGGVLPILPGRQRKPLSERLMRRLSRLARHLTRPVS